MEGNVYDLVSILAALVVQRQQRFSYTTKPSYNSNATQERENGDSAIECIKGMHRKMSESALGGLTFTARVW